MLCFPPKVVFPHPAKQVARPQISLPLFMYVILTTQTVHRPSTSTGVVGGGPVTRTQSRVNKEMFTIHQTSGNI